MDTTNHTQLIARLKRQPRHGGAFDDFMKALDTGKIVVAAGAATTAYTQLGGAFKALDTDSSLLVRSLETQVQVQRDLNTVYLKTAQSSLFLELRNKDLNKAFGLNSISAAKLSGKLQGVAKDLKITGIQVQQYAINIKKMLPTLDQMRAADSKQYAGLMRVQQVMTTNLGLTADQAEKYMGYAGQRGKDAEATLKSQFALSQAIEATTGDIGAFKMISEGIAETAEDVQLQYGKMPANLGVAIVKAKALGFSMNDLKKTADNLLNIESSIGQELEYQLLSGRRLVGSDKAQADLRGKSLTNSYREAALQGNGLKQAETLNTILEQEGETLSNNLFARQQMSQLLGMDEASLARALQKKSILQDLPGGDALFDKTGDELMAAAEAMGADGDQMKKLLDSQDTRTTDDKMLQEMEMLTDVLIHSIAPDMEKAVREARDAAAAGGKLTGLGPASPGLAKTAAKVKLEQEAVTNSNTFGQNFGTVKTMEVSQMNVAYGADTPIGKADDMLSPAGGYGTRTLTGPEGSIQLNNKDTVLAGTNLFDKSSTDNVALANTMLQVGAMIVAAIKSGGVNLNNYYSD